jgi:hypothetical protein
LEKFHLDVLTCFYCSFFLLFFSSLALFTALGTAEEKFNKEKSFHWENGDFIGHLGLAL